MTSGIIKHNKSKMQLNKPVAIIGMGCLFPRSASLKEYWRLLSNGIDGITDIPDTHWSPDDFFDADPAQPDHVYCKRGGFLPKIPFDPMEFGIPPSSLEATDTSQLLALVAAKMALEDSGYGEKSEFNRDKTSVILGVTGTQELVIPLGARLGFPKWRAALEKSGIAPQKAEEVINRISESYPAWQENSFPGLLGNVVAGRICNRLNLGGTNCVVDAACASSMSAVNLAMMELQSGRSDMVVTGGVDTLNDIFMHMCFAKTMTLSSSGDARPFSKDADGTVLGEGIGMLVLKRLEDAEKDHNKIYAVIKSIGSSSDGKSQSIYAPRVEGQVKALTRAYEFAGINPDSIELIEAHGTGTRVGDAVEFKALSNIFSPFSLNGHKCALGSVKSMIGHTKAAAGASGIIKAAMALYGKVLPPTLKADVPDPELDFESTPFYLNQQKKPWLPKESHPRRSGVSAFGFGGSNFHLVLEEYQKKKEAVTWDGSVDILAFSADSIPKIINQMDDFKASISGVSAAAEILAKTAITRNKFTNKSRHRLLIALEQPVDFDDYLPLIFDRIETSKTYLLSALDKTSWNLQNIFYGSGKNHGGTGFLFPGQGSQYVGMGLDIACTFPGALDALNSADKEFGGKSRISDFIYPYSLTNNYKETDSKKIDQNKNLAKTDIAQPAIGAVSLAMLRALQYFGLKPDAVAGHSFGELTALLASGRIDVKTFFALTVARGVLMAAAGKNKDGDSGAMLAVQAPLEELDELIIKENFDLVLANRNSMTQGVLSGATESINKIDQICREKGYRTVRLDVSAAFHSALVADVVEPFLNIVDSIDLKPSKIPVFSNTTGVVYPADSQEAKTILGRHPGLPVDFLSNIQNMYASGIRTFIEIGPKAVLTGLVKAILKDKTVNAVAIDISSGKNSGIADLARVLCNLGAAGLELDLTKWEDASIPCKKHLMNIPLTGANYIEKKGFDKTDSFKKVKNISANKTQQKIINDSPGNKSVNRPVYNMGEEITPAVVVSKGSNIVKKKTENNSIKRDSIFEALKVVQEGLKSMQALQFKTAETHEKFLETQAEASRTLQKMMESTCQLTEAASGFRPSPVSRGTLFTADKVVSSLKTKTLRAGTDLAAKSIENPESIENQKQPQENEKKEQPQENRTALNSVQSSHPNTEPETVKEIEKNLLEVVTMLTGYPSEMLDLEMDIESDLGIDSIKRVEIFSTLEEKLPDLPAISPEKMADLKTLGQIINYFSQNSASNIISDTGTEERTEISETHSANELPGFEHAEIKNHLLEVVSELTGYPSEMLGLEMDIDSDLGIDSIKRVEIFSTLEEKLPDLPAISPEKMADLKTLGQIVDYLAQESYFVNSDETDNADFAAVAAKPELNLDSNSELNSEPVQNEINKVEKRVIALVKYPFAKQKNISIPSGRKIYITNSGTGLAEAIAAEFAQHGIETVIISKTSGNKFYEPESAGGLVLLHDDHLSAANGDFLKDAFLLAKNFARELLDSASKGGALFGLITSMDGAFGFKGGSNYNPFYGGLAGLVKTAAIEWTGVNCRAIDLEPGLLDLKGADLKNIAAKAVLELLNNTPSFSVETGLGADSAISLKLEALTDGSADKIIKPNIDADDVILITGGAKGITAACGLAIAEYAKPALVLLGRSPAPAPEPDWLISFESEADMKKAILEHYQSSPDQPSSDQLHGPDKKLLTPLELEKEYRKYLSNREISANLEKMKTTGARVSYYSVDIRNPEAVKTVYNQVRSLYGPVTGIIHGAGVLEDRLIIDKTLEQFEKVFDTKVKGFNALLAASQDDELKFIVIFSSITARLGNTGQADYAMANEVLNKIAMQEAMARPESRVVSINWGPWDGGMVSASLKKEFASQGIALISFEKGAEYMLRELSLKPGNPVEVVIGADITAKPAILSDALPDVLSDNSTEIEEELSLAFKQEVDLQKFPVLQSHMLDGKAVVPFALMAEWFGHGALHANPGLFLHGLDDMRLLNGIKLQNDTKIIRLMTGNVKKNGTIFELKVELKDGIKENGQDLVHSRAKVILTSAPVKPPEYTRPEQNGKKPYFKTIDDVYEQVLFHGDKLRGLKKIISVSSLGMIAEVASAPSPADWIINPLRSRWIADPLVLDSAFQMATLWCYEEKGLVSLPSYAASYRQYRKSFPVDGATVILQVKNVTAHKMTGDFTFIDFKKEVIATLSGYESVMDASLYKSFKPEYAASN